MSRDRFQELHDQGNAGAPGGWAGRFSGGDSKEHRHIEMNTLAAQGAMTSDDEFFTLIDRVTEEMSMIDQRIQKITQLHEQALAATSDQRHGQIASDRDRVVEETNAMTRDVKQSLQTIDQVLKRSEGDASVSKSQQVARANRQQALARRFAEQISRYRQMEHQFEARNRERLERQYRIARPDATDEEVREAVEGDGAAQIFAQSVMQSSRVGEARRVMRDVEERQADIKKIERTIAQLAQMFTEVSEMVDRQQEMIDSIESAVEDTHVQINSASTEVGKAIVIRKKSRKRLWIILILVIILIVIIVLIIYFTVIKK